MRSDSASGACTFHSYGLNTWAWKPLKLLYNRVLAFFQPKCICIPSLLFLSAAKSLISYAKPGP